MDVVMTRTMDLNSWWEPHKIFRSSLYIFFCDVNKIRQYRLLHIWQHLSMNLEELRCGHPVDELMS